MNIFIVSFEWNKTNSTNYNLHNRMKSTNKPLINCFSRHLFFVRFTYKKGIVASGYVC
jgi:hypothetical protein